MAIDKFMSKNISDLSKIIGSDNVQVKLGIYSASATVSGDFDDFTIESGTMN